jgi:hypothetical protein
MHLYDLYDLYASTRQRGEKILFSLSRIKGKQRIHLMRGMQVQRLGRRQNGCTFGSGSPSQTAFIAVLQKASKTMDHLERCGQTRGDDGQQR